jgi:predicted nuclease with TOPRIM domain
MKIPEHYTTEHIDKELTEQAIKENNLEFYVKLRKLQILAEIKNTLQEISEKLND